MRLSRGPAARAGAKHVHHADEPCCRARCRSESDDNGALLIHCLDVGQPVAAQLAAEEALLARVIGAGTGRWLSFCSPPPAFVLAMVALGLVRILRGPGDADRIMAAQLLGTGGIAVLLLLSQAMPDAGRGGCRADAGVAGGLRLGRLCQSARDPAREADETMSLALDGLTILAVSAGAFFFLAGTVGLLRFPDALSRLHALTKADNLGLGLDRARAAAAGRRVAGGAEAGRRLALHPAGRSRRHPADRAPPLGSDRPAG